ncbi:Uncharacterised protein [Kluyvera cryocrescens]|uniref:Uncharacterized protein n=1 Tax=Kluyvera cryocrescens TaxID=580 RepID=A0A485AS55_KLUCR|nr:Uncharacterised protein [Kluyvera cryocrescens]
MFTQSFFDTNQLVVFSNTVRTAHRTSFDLACSGTNSQVSDGSVFSFARTVRDDSSVASVFRHFDRSQSFGQGTDLVEFDQDGVNDAFFDAFFQDLGVGYEQIVTNPAGFCRPVLWSGMRNQPSQIRPGHLRWRRLGTVWSDLPGSE